MKRLFILLVLSVYWITSVAQRNVDLDRFNFTATYRDLPKAGLDTSYHTFSIHFDPGTVARYVQPGEQFEERVRIPGWKKLPSGAHVDVEVTMEDVFVEKLETTESAQPIKDKDGKEIGKKYTYYVDATYTYGAKAFLADYKGAHIETYILASRNDKKVQRSSAFTSKAEADAYARFGYLLITNNLIKQCGNNVVNQLNNTLAYYYGYTDRYVNDYLWIVGSRKHPEYDDHRKAFVDFKEAMILMSANEPLDNVKQKMQPVIDYFLKVKKMYTSKKKGDRKMRYASCFNLAKIYYYLDDPDAAMREASELVMNGYDTRDGKQLEAAATSLKRLFRDTKFNTRHFPLREEDFQGPEMVSGNFQ